MVAWKVIASELRAEGRSRDELAEAKKVYYRTYFREKKRVYDAARRAKRDRWVDVAPEIPGLIPLRAKGRTIVDFVRVDIDRWDEFRHMKFASAGGYALTRVDGENAYLHHLVLGQTFKKGDGVECDHINRDRLDNRRENLRVVTPKENAANQLRRMSRLAA